MGRRKFWCMACAMAMLRAHVVWAAPADACAEPPRTLVREVREAVQGSAATITVAVPGSRAPLVVTLERTAVDLIAQVGGETSLALRSPAPLDARDTFLIEPTSAEPIQIVLKPAEV